MQYDHFWWRGQGQSESRLTDSKELWELTFSFNELSKTVSATWASVVQKDGPQARNEHIAVYSEGKMYIFGGVSENDENQREYGDIWEFSSASQSWKQIIIDTDKKAPRPRFSHAGTLATPSNSGGNVTEPTLIVFGGRYVTSKRHQEFKDAGRYMGLWPPLEEVARNRPCRARRRTLVPPFASILVLKIGCLWWIFSSRVKRKIYRLRL